MNGDLFNDLGAFSKCYGVGISKRDDNDYQVHSGSTISHCADGVLTSCTHHDRFHCGWEFNRNNRECCTPSLLYFSWTLARLL